MSTWLGQMPDTITVAPQTGVRDSDGAPEYGAQVEVKCMYVGGASVVRNQDGEVVSINASIYTHNEISQTHAIWVEGTDTAKEDEARTPVAVKAFHDLSGSDHLWEVEL